MQQRSLQRCVSMLSLFTCVLLTVTPWTVAARLLCPWGFSRQEYWSGLPCPSPGDLPNPGIESRFPALQGDSLPSEPPGRIDHLQSVPRSPVICIIKNPLPTNVSFNLSITYSVGNYEVLKTVLNLYPTFDSIIREGKHFYDIHVLSWKQGIFSTMHNLIFLFK